MVQRSVAAYDCHIGFGRRSVSVQLGKPRNISFYSGRTYIILRTSLSRPELRVGRIFICLEGILKI